MNGFPELARAHREWKRLHDAQESEKAELLLRSVLARNEAESSAEIERIPEPHRERLNAYGREWERLLFAAGIRSGYSLCYARASLSVSEVGDFFRWLAQRLESNERPDGYVLFFESDGKDPIVGSEWRCVFYFMLRSDYAPERVALENGAPSLSIDELGRIA